MEATPVTELDMEIIERIQKRQTMSGGKVGVKEDDPLVQWAKSLDVNPAWLLRFLYLMEAIKPYQYEVAFPSVVTLQTVIPIVRMASQKGIDFCLTHLDQYKHCSVVYVVIHNPDPHRRFHGIGHRPVEAQMDINGADCTARRSSWRHDSDGPNIHLSFIITPKLPQDLSGIDFRISFDGAQITDYEAVETCTRVDLTHGDETAYRNEVKPDRRRKNPSLPYNEEFREIDEGIVRSLKHRSELAKINELHPTCLDVEQLAEQFDIHPKWLQNYLSTARGIGTFEEYVEPIRKTNHPVVVYPERHAKSHGIHYRVSQMEQYENCSMVQLDILVDPMANIELRNWSSPRLIVQDSVCCSFRSGGGGGLSMRFNFLVAPALPDDLAGVQMAIELDDPYAYEPTVIEVKAVQL